MTEKKLLMNYRVMYLVDILLYVIFQTALVTLMKFFGNAESFPNVTFISFSHMILANENWVYFFFRIMCAIFYVKKMPIFSEKYKKKIKEWKIRGKTVGKNVGIF